MAAIAAAICGSRRARSQHALPCPRASHSAGPPYVEAGTELLQFSPTEALAETERAIQEWMAKQGT